MTEEPTKLEKLLQRAKELYQQGDFEASADCYQKLLAAKETRAEAYYGLGLIEFNQKQYAAALDYFTTATQVSPTNANAYYYMGAIHEEGEAFEEAKNCYLKALSANPNHRGAKEKIARLGSKASDKLLCI
jgi:tetratricopeptide (TPR) repeat protein